MIQHLKIYLSTLKLIAAGNTNKRCSEESGRKQDLYLLFLKHL